MNKYLIALPCFPNSKGFCYPTILVKATDKTSAIALVKHLRPNANIGEIKAIIMLAYKLGHRDARHESAELALFDTVKSNSKT
jgi:hypothetical protein